MGFPPNVLTAVSLHYSDDPRGQSIARILCIQTNNNVYEENTPLPSQQSITVKRSECVCEIPYVHYIFDD